MAGSWSTALQALLRPARDSISIQDNLENPKVYRHPPGVIWKQVLGMCVFLDMADSASERRRRFVRLESMGLSGVVFYEIPAGKDLNGLRGLGDQDNDLTRMSIFGDPNDPTDLGMEVDVLIDLIGAKLVYFPAYACTSFSAGLAMNAFIHNKPSLMPFSACEGFFIDLRMLSVPDVECTSWSTRSPRPISAVILKYLKSPVPLANVFLDLAGPEEISGYQDQDQDWSLDFNPYGQGRRSEHSDEAQSSDSEDEGNISMSTENSIGPRTPPRVLSSRTNLQAGLAPSCSLRFASGLEEELGYILGDAIALFDRSISLDSTSMQEVKDELSNDISKENCVPNSTWRA